jgi:tetratricopeptide (TPR) repeat protein
MFGWLRPDKGDQAAPSTVSPLESRREDLRVLLRSARAKSLTHPAEGEEFVKKLIALLCQEPGRTSWQTHYNLASYYATVKEYEDSLTELKLAAESGLLGGRPAIDPTFAALKKCYEKDFAEALAPYGRAEAAYLSEFEVIGLNFAVKLAARHVEGPFAFIDRYSKSKEREELANDLDISPDLADEWFDLLELAACLDLRPSEANLLATARVGSIGRLRRWTNRAEKLQEVLAAANATYRFLDNAPGVDRINGWFLKVTPAQLPTRSET